MWGLDMQECSKAFVRRSGDINFVTRYFVGSGIDIGAGPDPLVLQAEFFPRMSGLRIWDIADGDAQLLQTIPDEQFDFVHSSHCLEHLHDPAEGLRNWLRVLKPGGHLVILVPDEDLYEQGVFPSTFNTDHKWTFTIFKTQSWSPRSLNILDLVANLGEGVTTHKIELLDQTFHYHWPRADQTTTPLGECGIEIILRKRTASEIAQLGRLPSPDGRMLPGVRKNVGG
jgi:SAM-dependent methyltransferase